MSDLGASAWRRFGQLALAFVGVAVLFAVLQFSIQGIGGGDFDGYYHIRWSRMLWDGLKHGHLPAFSSLPLTTLNPRQYADQHFLFHLLLMPFTWFGSLVTGAKLAAIVFATLAVVSCLWLVWRYHVRYAPLWLLALVGSSSLFLERMSMTRAQSVSLVFIVAGMRLLFEGKYRWLALAAFLYVWTYNLFVVLAVMALLWVAVGWWTERRLEWSPLLWTAAGILAGFVVNPYFPRNARLFWENLTDKAVIQPGAGSEWYALPSWLLLKACLIAFAAMFLGYLAFGFLLSAGQRRTLRRPLFLLILSTLLLIATARSKRFTEYWPPVAVLFAAFTLQAVWDTPGTTRAARSVATPSTRDTDVPTSRPTEKRKALQLACITLLLLAAAAYEVRMAGLEIASPFAPDEYRAGAAWLRAHAPPGETVFNVDWDDFPKLFYYDPSRPYVSGLDPIYLADASPSLGRLYDRIASGQGGDAADAIRAQFGAHYVFLGQPLDRPFYVRARLSGQFEKVYEDSQCMILRVRDED